jgi:hypothetical protein
VSSVIGELTKRNKDQHEPSNGELSNAVVKAGHIVAHDQAHKEREGDITNKIDIINKSKLI